MVRVRKVANVALSRLTFADPGLTLIRVGGLVGTDDSALFLKSTVPEAFSFALLE
jgi:hypothetical protein